MNNNPQSLAPTCWVAMADGILLAIKAQPGAKRTALGTIIEAAPSPGWPPARLKISIAAPPEDGRANDAIITTLAKHFQLKPAAITLETGHTARDKKFFLRGDVATLASLIPSPC